MSKGHLKHRGPGQRPGEGHVIPLRVSQVVGVDGHTVTTFGVDLSNAPVPDRKYVADVYAVHTSSSGVKLLFGQQRIGGAELRSLLVIHMSEKAVEQFLDSLPDGTGGNLRFEDIAAQFNATAQLASEIKVEPAQVVAFKAGAIVGAMSGPDSCMDFYQVSPTSILAAKRSDSVAVDPVVRVDMSSALLLGLTQELRRIFAAGLAAKGA